MRKSIPGARLRIIGGPGVDADRGYAGELEEEAARLGLEDAVEMAGHVADGGEAIRGLDILAHPAQREPWGLVLLEALAAGVPVAASAEGGPAEIVRDGVDGLLVDASHVASLAAALVRLGREPSLRTRMGAAGRERVSTGFTAERAAASLWGDHAARGGLKRAYHGEVKASEEERTQQRVAIARALAVDGMTGEVATALDGAGVRMLLLKGPVLATWLYDDGAARAYVNCDLLVPPEDYAAAGEVLGWLRVLSARPRPAAYFEPRLGPCTRTPGGGPNGAEVDLHRALPGMPPKSADRTCGVPCRRERNSSAWAGFPSTFHGPRRERSLVALHAAHHGTEQEKPLEDLRRAVDRVPFGHLGGDPRAGRAPAAEAAIGDRAEAGAGGR